MSYKTISLEELNQILMQFGQNIGLRDLALDDNAAVSLVFDDEFLVEIQALDRQNDYVRTLYLLAVLSPSPQADDAKMLDFYQKLLEVNLSGAMMNGAAFALDPDNQEVLLLATISASSLTVAVLENEMEKFFNTLEHWASVRNNGVLDFSHDPSAHASQADKSGASMGQGGVRI